MLLKNLKFITLKKLRVCRISYLETFRNLLEIINVSLVYVKKINKNVVVDINCHVQILYAFKIEKAVKNYCLTITCLIIISKANPKIVITQIKRKNLKHS
jgi:hypothetical protein